MACQKCRTPRTISHRDHSDRLPPIPVAPAHSQRCDSAFFLKAIDSSSQVVERSRIQNNGRRSFAQKSVLPYRSSRAVIWNLCLFLTQSRRRAANNAESLILPTGVSLSQRKEPTRPPCKRPWKNSAAP